MFALKGIVHPNINLRFCHHSLTPKLFQTCIHFFILLNFLFLIMIQSSHFHKKLRNAHLCRSCCMY